MTNGESKKGGIRMDTGKWEDTIGRHGQSNRGKGRKSEAIDVTRSSGK